MSVRNDEAWKEARSLVAVKSWVGARAELLDLAQTHPEDDRITALIADMHVGTGDRQGARDLAEEALSKERTAPLLAALAQVQIVLGDFDSASTLLKEAKKLEPDDSFVLETEFVMAFLQNDHDLAGTIADHLIVIDSEHPPHYSKRVPVDIVTGNWTGLCANLDQPHPCYKGTYHHLRDLGWRARVKGQYAEAEGFLRQAIDLAPKAESPWRHLYLTYMASGQMAEAESAARVAYSLNPANAATLRVLAKGARARGNFAEAERFDQLADNDTLTREWAHSNAAVNFLNHNMIDEAINAYREGIRTGKPFARAQMRKLLLNLLIGQGLWRDAEGLLGEIEAGGELDGRDEINRARILHYRGASQAALDLLTTVADDPHLGLLARAHSLPMLGKLRLADRLNADIEAIKSPHATPNVLAQAISNLRDMKCTVEAMDVLAFAKPRYGEMQAIKLQEAQLAFERGDVALWRKLVSETNFRPRPLSLSRAIRRLVRRIFTSR